jgi:type VI secretion system protein ImpA
MAESAVLDFATLLAPVAADQPCGTPVPYEVRAQLEEARKEDNPDDYAPDDPARPETFRKANWPAIVRLAGDTLARSSKDLLVAARLTEALTRLHGFAGLRDGLRLLRELIEQHWDQLYPSIEDGDLEVRAAPFNWLDDNVRGIHFPDAVRMLPLVAGKSGAASWLDWRRSQDGRGAITREQFDRIAAEALADDCARTAAEIDECSREIELLRRQLDTRLGGHAPGLIQLRQAIADCQTLLSQILGQKRPAGGPETDNRAEMPASSAQPGTGGAIRSRAEAYRQLAQAAAVLQELEPHSPIPYLIKRAVELGSLTFPELIVKLIRDENVLAELSRELGIKREESS